jgi:flagellar hook-basal body complex protein FliE
MKDLEIRNVVSSSVTPAASRSPKSAKDPLTDFNKILSSSVKDINGEMRQADQSIQDMSLGKMDIHNAMIDVEKASLSFRLLMQVRNRMISAYEEIMRMQF